MTSADNANAHGGSEYRDYDSEQMGLQSKRRRMNNASFGGHHNPHQNDFMGAGDNGNQLPFSKSMSMPQTSQGVDHLQQ